MCVVRTVYIVRPLEIQGLVHHICKTEELEEMRAALRIPAHILDTLDIFI